MVFFFAHWRFVFSKLYGVPCMALADLRGAKGALPPPPQDARGDIQITLQLRKVVSFWETSSPRPTTGAPPLDPAGGHPLNWPPPSSFSGSAPGLWDVFRVFLGRTFVCGLRTKTKKA